MRILSFGEILFDIYADKLYLGGAPLNLAAHSALLGADAYLLSAVGKDDLGQEAMRQIKKLNINTDYIKTLTDKETGKCIVTLDENAVPTYNLLTDTAYDYIPYPEFLANAQFDIFAFGTLALRKPYNYETIKHILKRKLCSEVYTDLNIRVPFYSEKSMSFCLENSTIVKISAEELPLVTKTVLGKSLSAEDAVCLISNKFPHIKLIIITCGDKGAFVLDTAENKTYNKEAVPVKAISTVGAGDSFGAAFLYEYFKSNNIGKALELASKVSAFVISKKEAVPPDMKDLYKNM